jgi:hypothetical protein
VHTVPKKVALSKKKDSESSNHSQERTPKLKSDNILFFQFRKGGLIKEKDSEREWADEYNWPLCTNGESHNIRRLLLAQIIPKNELLDLADKLHKLRLRLNLNQFCHPQKNEDFTDAYSLQRLASDKKSRVCNWFFSEPVSLNKSSVILKHSLRSYSK